MMLVWNDSRDTLYCLHHVPINELNKKMKTSPINSRPKKDEIPIQIQESDQARGWIRIP